METSEKKVHDENHRKIFTYVELKVAKDYLTRKQNYATSCCSPVRNQGGRVSGIDNISMLPASIVAKVQCMAVNIWKDVY